jgi:hypothetical protein
MTASKKTVLLNQAATAVEQRYKLELAMEEADEGDVYGVAIRWLSSNGLSLAGAGGGRPANTEGLDEALGIVARGASIEHAALKVASRLGENEREVKNHRARLLYQLKQRKF